MKVTLPDYQDQKSGLLTVATEGGYIHQSYMTEDGHVIVFEFIPENYPASTMGVYENLEDYIESIRNVYWINDNDYALTTSWLLEEAGYPFNTDEEEAYA